MFICFLLNYQAYCWHVSLNVSGQTICCLTQQDTQTLNGPFYLTAQFSEFVPVTGDSEKMILSSPFGTNSKLPL